MNAIAIAWSSGNGEVTTVSESGSSLSVQIESTGSTTVGSRADECVYGPDDIGTDSVDECLCQYLAELEAAPVAVTSTCPVPDGEIASTCEWANDQGSPAVHRFVQTLTPSGTSFAGSTITESDEVLGTHSCYLENSRFRYATGVTGTTWVIGEDDRWRPDEIGWYNGAVLYQRQHRSTMDLPMPGGFPFSQRLKISGCGSGSVRACTDRL